MLFYQDYISYEELFLHKLKIFKKIDHINNRNIYIFI